MLPVGDDVTRTVAHDGPVSVGNVIQEPEVGVGFGHRRVASRRRLRL